MANETTESAFDETKHAWRRLTRALRWGLIEWHLGRVVNLVRADDPDALPLLTALSQRFDKWTNRDE